STIPSGFTSSVVSGSSWVYNYKSKVVLNGDSSGNNIDNYASNVIINGNNGNDFLTSWDKNYSTNSSTTLKNVTINGGAGSDTIYSFTDNSLINGDDGNDKIYGSADYVTINGGKGNDTISTLTNNVIIYANGDGNDVITQVWDDTKIKITSGSYSTLTSGDDFIIKVGSGRMTLKDAAYLADDIQITGTRAYVEEHWFTEDNNFVDSDLDSIIQSTTNNYSIGEINSSDVLTQSLDTMTISQAKKK
ncbi:MAG: hypothetical protein IJ728_00545, partial [Selenomonadaceae bacterium]|nr:hypothetical protein [Selenomonadaceae bacterium]